MSTRTLARITIGCAILTFAVLWGSMGYRILKLEAQVSALQHVDKETVDVLIEMEDALHSLIESYGRLLEKRPSSMQRVDTPPPRVIDTPPGAEQYQAAGVVWDISYASSQCHE
jgi:hypothetical protein